ncbi:MAG: mechanosensitive ion channel family protein [Thermoplasmata archaeon]|nr:mechanosensitive ion channel family protein [Thermoplasmata archaeon]
MDLTPYLLPLLIFGLTVALTALLSRLAHLVVEQAMSQSNPQVAAGAALLASVVIWLIGAVVIIQQLGISPDILLLVVGLLGVAALLSLREQLENYGGKYFSDIYSPYKVGDSIRFREHEGKVIEINAMTTILLSEDDHLIAVPNSMFMREVVVNTTPQAWRELTFPVSIGGSVDLAAFEGGVLRSLSKLRTRLDRRFPPVITTRSRTPLSTELTVTVMIRRPEDREAITLEVNKRIMEARGKAPPTPPKAAGDGRGEPPATPPPGTAPPP